MVFSSFCRVAFAENASGVQKLWHHLLARLPFSLPDELSVDRRDSDSTRLVCRSSNSSYYTTD